MTPDGGATYPGELAAPDEVLRLAEAYRQAAELSAPMGRRGDPLSRAPYRLLAIHAVELYLSALLLHAGHGPGAVRGLQHDLAARAKLAADSGLQLRQRTMAHLAAMCGRREYVVTRYGPEMTATLSQLNRLAATLDEVAGKTVALMTAGRFPPG